jgi:Holliday junction DNA helicase RuvA
MITHLSGKLILKTPALIVVEVGSVGFDVQVSLNTYENIGPEGSKVSLHTHLHVREDAVQLFGFSDASERAMFRELISVSGVGPKLALAALSGMTASRMHDAIVREDYAALTSISGIGKKTAQRVVVDLRERLSGADELVSEGRAGQLTQSHNDAVSALCALGMKQSVAEESVRRVLKRTESDLTIEELIRLALKK